VVIQRLPKDADALRDFPAKLYNAPVTPLRRVDERSLEGVVINNIHLMRTGQYVSPVCDQRVKRRLTRAGDPPPKKKNSTFRKLPAFVCPFACRPRANIFATKLKLEISGNVLCNPIPNGSFPFPFPGSA